MRPDENIHTRCSRPAAIRRGEYAHKISPPRLTYEPQSATAITGLRVQLPAYAVNVALPAFAAARRSAAPCCCDAGRAAIDQYFIYRLRGVVVSGVRRINEVKARRSRLVPGWVTVFGRVYHLGM